MTSQVQIPENLSTITRRGVSRIISEEEFTAMLRRGTPLRLKMGFDPSRPDIHLGHVVRASASSGSFRISGTR